MSIRFIYLTWCDLKSLSDVCHRRLAEQLSSCQHKLDILIFEVGHTFLSISLESLIMKTRLSHCFLTVKKYY